MREPAHTGRWTVRWRERPGPVVAGGGQAVVASVAATSRDVDSAILAGHGPIAPPFAPGHEAVARVVDVGDAVTGVAHGDLLVVPWSISHGTRRRCATGLTAHCSAVPHPAMYRAPIGGTWGGLFSLTGSRGRPPVTSLTPLGPAARVTGGNGRRLPVPGTITTGPGTTRVETDAVFFAPPPDQAQALFPSLRDLA